MNALSLVRWAAEAAPEMSGPKTEGVERRLAALRLERVGLSERLNAIADILSKFGAAAEAERRAVAAVAAIGDADVAAIRSWAAGGSVGPAPRPDMTARTEANDRLVEAMVHAQTVQVAGGDLEAERSEIAARLAALNERLEQCALDALSERFADELGGLVTLGEEVQSKQARVYGCTAFMREIAERHQMAGRNDKAIAIFKRLEQLAKLDEKPEFAPSVAAVAAAAPAWKAIYERFINV